MIEKTKGTCQHDINYSDSSILLSRRRFFTTPNEVYGVCKNCGTSLTYIKLTKYVLKEEKEMK